MTQISFVLGSYNRSLFLRETIASIRKESAGMEVEILVVDGGSTDGALAWLLEQRDIITIVQHNRGEWGGKALVPRSWGYFMNLAFRNATGDAVCMLSDDCILLPGSLRAAWEQWSSDPDVGAMPFYWRNGGKADEYFVSSYGGVPFVNHGIYSRQALAAVGYADEQSFGFYAGDIDLCLKMTDSGYRIVPCQKALVEHWPHLPGDTRPFNEAKMARDFAALKDKWKQNPLWSRPEESIHLEIIQKPSDLAIAAMMRAIEKKMRGNPLVSLARRIAAKLR